MPPVRRFYLRFRQTNLWALIALVALAGWTIDALLMFLRMHPASQAGLADFARHFWYAAPVLVAVIVLSRLRRNGELLGVAVYDEAGRLVRQEGACGLEEVTAAESLAAMRADGRQNLHGLSLPSGAQVYFVRQGAYTLLLSYSSAANSMELESGIRQMRASLPPATFDLFADLGPRTAALAAAVLCSPVKRDSLAYLYRCSRTAMQVADLEYHVGYSEGEIEPALVDLERLGLLERFCACELVFYRLSRDDEVLTALQALFEWQATWQVQLTRLSSIVGEPAIEDPSFARHKPTASLGQGRGVVANPFDPRIRPGESRAARSQPVSQTDPGGAAADRTGLHRQ